MASKLYRSIYVIGCGGVLLYGAVLKKHLDKKNSASWTGKFAPATLLAKMTGDGAQLPYDAYGTSMEWDYNWDKRQQHTEIDKTDKSSRAMKHYLFVRHGNYDTNGISDEERKLSPLGQEQAELTGKWLASQNLNYTKIVQSTMTRARETCEKITEYLPHIKVSTTDLLCEGAPIRPDPPNRAYEPELKYHSDGPRIEAAFRKFVHRPATSDKNEPVEVYVCHANVIRYFICRAMQFPPHGWLRISLPHGSVTWITVYSDGDVCLRCAGDTGFMPPSKLSR